MEETGACPESYYYSNILRGLELAAAIWRFFNAASYSLFCLF